MVSRQSWHSMMSCPSENRCSICGCNTKQLNVQLERLMFYKDVCTLYHSTVCMCAVLFDITLHHPTLRWAISHNATPFVCTLYHSPLRWAISRNATLFYVRCTIRHYAEPFHATLHRLCVRRTIRHYAELFNATLHCLCVSRATRHNPEPFPATLHRLCTILQMNTKLFVIKLVNFMISCSNSTWATRPFIIG